MRQLLIGLLLVALLTPALAADWTKPYFAATTPGAWAKTKSTSTIGPPSVTTYTRLPDENGQIVIDQYSEFDNKDTPPSTMRYTLASGFNADRELIDFLRAITAASARVAASIISSFTMRARTSMAPRKMNGKPRTLLTWFG